MKLYEEILFLKHYADCLWVVENVKPYYNVLIKATQIQRHLFWSNFPITNVIIDNDLIRTSQIPQLEKIHGFNLSKYKLKNKRQILRNCVKPELGLHILNCALKNRKEN